MFIYNHASERAKTLVTTVIKNIQNALRTSPCLFPSRSRVICEEAVGLRGSIMLVSEQDGRSTRTISWRQHWELFKPGGTVIQFAREITCATYCTAHSTSDA
ncbi:hypothetical protein Y032_0272g930 [Ancylostoma ceylanicum]|uniref:Uncharacterized protein n=1 Tax=Ancylostoma ceylanicum TaxID=53326 RepID=A0A016S907_9BILA|nr:hypothetical protein Y032_0272g930 [Ancylostoma ceylanicum]